MIQVVRENLLFSNCTIIAHQTNCLKRMNYGFARNVKRMYPEAYRADIDYTEEKDERFGKCSFALSEDSKKIIFNLYGQLTEDGETDYEAFEKSFERMLITVDRFESKGFPIKIGVPYLIGCGVDNGKGDIDIIHDIIKKLAKRYRRTIYLYQ